MGFHTTQGRSLFVQVADESFRATILRGTSILVRTLELSFAAERLDFIDISAESPIPKH